MREILFRGKRSDGKWVFGDLHAEIYNPEHDPRGCKSRIEASIYAHDKDKPWSGAIYEVEPRTVGEYSGYKDSNGTKIFEGDVLEFRVGALKTERKAIVEYKEGAFQARCDKKNVMMLVNVRNYSSGTTEVIGNIHDNPELLAEILG